MARRYAMARRRNGAGGAIVAVGALVVGLGLLWWGGGVFGSDATTAVDGSVPGVTIGGGTYSAKLWRFLAALRKAVRADVPITATSGLRTMARQAQIMLDFYQDNGKEKFLDLYGVAAERLLKLPYSMWPAEVVRLYAEDILHADQHTGGGAIDVSIKGLQQWQIDAIIAGARSLGASVKVEDPPLLHIYGIAA